MQRGSLRARMLDCLRQLEAGRGSQAKRLRTGAGRLPLRDLIQFMEVSGDAQVECAKRCLWKMSFNAPLFPPAILFRRMLSLQTAEKTQDRGGRHRPRDHVRHLVYLTVLGLYLFTIDPQLQKRFDRQAGLQKRRHRLAAAGSAELFVQAWMSFCIFHDIGYPIERYHSADNDAVREEIGKQTLSLYQDLPSAYAEEYATRLVANLCALVALLEFDVDNFEHLVMRHLDAAQTAELQAAVDQLDLPAANFASLRKTSPIALFSPPYARLIGMILGRSILLAVMESESSGKILWLGNEDGSIDIACDQSMRGARAREIAFGSGPREGSGVSVKYYPCASLSASDVIHAVIPETDGNDDHAGAAGDIEELCRFLLLRDDFRRQARGTEQQTIALSGVAYGVLCGTDFMDHSRADRFERVESADVIRAAVNQHAGQVVAQLAKSFGQALEERRQSGSFLPEHILSTRPSSKAYIELATQALEIDLLTEIFKNRLQRKVTAGGLERQEIAGLMEAVHRQHTKDSGLLASMSASLRETIDPDLERSVRRGHALNRVFGVLLPLVKKILAQAMKAPEMNGVKGLAKADLTSPDVIRTLYGEEGFGMASPMLAESDKETLGAIGQEYDPKWLADHGFYAAAMALWSASQRLAILRRGTAMRRKGGEDATLDAIARLMTFNPESPFHDAEADALCSATDLCYRSIALHNFYPGFSKHHQKMSQTIGGNPFTYIALLSDALQNWDRDVQYDPGKYDLAELRPDGFYNIFHDGERISVVVSRAYFSETRIMNLRRDLGEYLRDLDAIVDIRLG